jgi:hypothetical protein
MNREMYRQGDLLILQISSLPEGLTLRPHNVILAGEATGHSHRLLAGRVLQDAQGQLFLEVSRATQVIHQEHRALTLQPGCYQVIRQREYTPKGIREVRD